MRERISIESRNDTITPSGAPNGGWVEYASRRADIEEKASAEKYEGDQNTVKLTHTVRIRYVEGVTHAMRVNWGGRILHIQGLTVDRKRREILLQCEERAQ